jgi:cytochrome c oxidase assembly factor CtaG
VVAGLLVAAIGWFALVRRVRRRHPDTPVPAARTVAFLGGLGAIAVALMSGIERYDTTLFSVHMVQHLLIGDLAPLLLALGLSGPLLRPLLAPRPVQRLRFLTHPLVALPLWALNLGVWHLPFLYDAALEHPLVHALQHVCFLAGGLLLWSTLLGLLPGPRWYGLGARLASLAVVWVVGAALANVFLWSDTAYYHPYVQAPRTWGLSPLDDQRAGGGVMLVEMMLVGAAVFVVLGLRWLEDAERRQRRLEARAS